MIKKTNEKGKEKLIRHFVFFLLYIIQSKMIYMHHWFLIFLSKVVLYSYNSKIFLINTNKYKNVFIFELKESDFS